MSKNKKQQSCVGCSELTWRVPCVCSKCLRKMESLIDCMQAEGYIVLQKGNDCIEKETMALL